MLRYCRACVMPETRPGVEFDENGVCNACNYHRNRSRIDWDERERALRTIFERYASKDGSNYDCIVPVSGGKDSTYQIVKVLELGYNPLAVTSSTCSLSDIGRKNLENIKALGVDLIEISMNPAVRHRVNRIALVERGDISWPEHASIFTVPIRIAVQMRIPLLIWGENSQNEYGGPGSDADKPYLDRRWLERYGGLLGMGPEDLSEKYGIDKKHLIQLQYPTDEELKSVGVTGVFLGYYLPWDGMRNFLIAQGHGFTALGGYVEGSLASYENLDNYQTGIHDYFKYLKFGFGRATDIACLHVRNGRMSRKEAMELVKKHDGKFPWTYLGRKIEEILEEIDMSLDEFVSLCDRYTNRNIFKCDEEGRLVKDRFGNLEKLNYDN